MRFLSHTLSSTNNNTNFQTVYFGRSKILLFSSTLPTQEEIESLPAFPREKLTLRLLLGSGAFGEVYEGVAVDVLGVGSGETKVAVKVMWIFQLLGMLGLHIYMDLHGCNYNKR